MKNSLLCCLAVATLLCGCAAAPQAAPQAAEATNPDTAECDRRMVDEKVDLESVKGKMRRDNCLEAMKLKPQLARMSPEVVKTTLAFTECKAEARSQNLPLAAHQDALYDCAFKHGGAPGRACLAEMILGKVPVDALEMNMAHCLQIKQGLPR